MKTTRWIAKCRCGAFTSTLATHDFQRVARGIPGVVDGALVLDTKGATGTYDQIALACRSCSKLAAAKPVRGKFSKKHECNAKCLSSHSGICECSCGGKNHGASYNA